MNNRRDPEGIREPRSTRGSYPATQQGTNVVEVSESYGAAIVAMIQKQKRKNQGTPEVSESCRGKEESLHPRSCNGKRSRKVKGKASGVSESCRAATTDEVEEPRANQKTPEATKPLHPRHCGETIAEATNPRSCEGKGSREVNPLSQPRAKGRDVALVKMILQKTSQRKSNGTEGGSLASITLSRISGHEEDVIEIDSPAQSLKRFLEEKAKNHTKSVAYGKRTRDLVTSSQQKQSPSETIPAAETAPIHLIKFKFWLGFEAMERIAKEQGLEELFTDETYRRPHHKEHPPQGSGGIRMCQHLIPEGPSNPISE